MPREGSSEPSRRSAVSFQRVAVLMGGWGEEREVSIRTGEAVAKALLHKGKGFIINYRSVSIFYHNPALRFDDNFLI
jgi:D-alanine-D-alanine ligase-like ATP-grasp enzyme